MPQSTRPSLQERRHSRPSCIPLLCLAIILVSGIAAPVSADAPPVITLDPGDSIQDAISAAAPGDTIILNPGIYRPTGQILVSKDIIITANTSAKGSPANTAVDGMDSPEGIFSLGDGVDFSVDNLTIRNGSHMFIGGAISAYPATSAGTLTVTSTVFRDCTAENGGAIGISGTTRDTVITASTFINCSATSMGGAINSNANSLTVTSSSFSGCTATSEGGAILTGTKTVITSTSFSDCYSGSGGAVATSSSDVDIHFSRFGNVTSAGQSDALYCWYGTVNVTDNWWGSSNEPSTATQLYMYGGTLTYNPWLVLNVSATPSTIPTVQKSVIRAALTKNSAGTDTAGSGIFVPTVIPVTYQRTKGTGTLSPPAGIMVSGSNTSRFTPATSGISMVSVTVDDETINVPVTVIAGAPVAQFTATPRTGLYPLTVRFTDTSANIPSSWKWTFGDGSAVNSTKQNPVHTYSLPGNYTVTLRATNVLGSNSSKKTGFIIVTAPAPRVTGIAPATGKRGAQVMITNLSGTGFRAGAKVFFNQSGSSLAVTNVTVVNANKIRCFVKIPAGAPIGPWNVSVRNTDGKSGAKVNAFTVKALAPPTVTGITPATGKRGTLIKITSLSGTGFIGTAKPTIQFVKAGKTVMATNVTVTSTTKLSCTVKFPATAATGPWNVRVTNADGQAGAKAGAFTLSV